MTALIDMPRKTANKTPPPLQPWMKWPRTPDLLEWMRTLLGLTDHMDSPKDRTAIPVQLAIGLIAELGEPLEALEWINRLEKSLPANLGSERSRFVMQAAEISLAAGMLEVMEEYLQRMLGMQHLFPRKCDRGWVEKRVREFRTEHGLLAPRDAVDEEQRAEASFNALVRSARSALDRGDKDYARQQLIQAIPVVGQLKEWCRRYDLITLIRELIRVGDEENVSQLLRIYDKAGIKERFRGFELLRLNLRDRAILRFQQEAKEALAELESEVLNAHFPAMSLEWAIVGLANAGEMALAREWLGRALSEGAAWNIDRMHAFSSAVFQSMAKAVARVEGPDAALAILDLAENRATNSHPSGWRTAAIGKNASLRIELSSTDKAEAIARSVRSPKERRKLLVNLFAKRQEWDKLHETLNTFQTPIEAAEMIYGLKFVWQVQR